jgi:hypothetical protein
VLILGATCMAELPAYLRIITGGEVEVPLRTFPLSAIGDAWRAASDSGRRVVILSG